MQWKVFFKDLEYHQLQGKKKDIKSGISLSYDLHVFHIKVNGPYQSFMSLPFKSIKYNIQNAVENIVKVKHYRGQLQKNQKNKFTDGPFITKYDRKDTMST